MSRFLEIRSTVLIVVGHGLLAEEEDRPVAYALRRAIRERGRGVAGHLGVVVTDAWMLRNEMADFFPAIALGGPGANAFTEQIYETLPVASCRARRVFVQMEADQAPRRAAVWGLEHEGTREAARIFVADGLLDRFLELVWRPEVG